MLIVLSPAKTLDYTPLSGDISFSEPEFIIESSSLISILKKLSASEISELMSLSDKLASLNVARYSLWSKKATHSNSKQALYAFNGDVYEGLQALSMSDKSIKYAQSHLRILSGLYGLLKPLDLMQPYRLEMGTVLKNKEGRDLYAFWGDKIADKLNLEFDQLNDFSDRILLNLASDEYFKSIKLSKLNAKVISPIFQDSKDGKFKVISFYAKRARGLMARFVLENQIKRPIDLKKFNAEGYSYNSELSSTEKPVFQRVLN